MNAIEITVAISIALICAAYYFGLKSGALEAGRAHAERLIQMRTECNRWRHKHHTEEQRAERIETELLMLQLQQDKGSTQPPSSEQRYTLLQAAYELDLASRTFSAFGAHDHAQKTTNLSKELRALAGPDPEPEAAAQAAKPSITSLQEAA